ncbi:MAG: hypothetical protein RLY71_3740 [Pseudomonadota bacterium]|jgi:carboxymethylenebutenolidase
MGTTISYQRPDGQTVQAYLAEPAGADASTPGLVVVQEWWGVNDQIRSVAERYAQAGYRVLVPDLYRGKVTLEEAEAHHLMTGLDFGAAAGQDVRGAVQHLKAGGAKVGVTGYCMGGALTFLAAVFVPEVDATAAWYGYPPLEYIDATRIKAPLLAHFATQDTFFSIDNVDALADKLRAAGVNFEFHRYDAMHAFANETQVDPHRIAAAKYDPEAAALAWSRTLAFFGQHLR